MNQTTKIQLPVAVGSIEHLRDTLSRMVGDPREPDLSMRQMCVLLRVYTLDEPQTVRGMAAELNVSKPAITRALDRLSQLDLIQRRGDPADRRSIFVARTTHGNAAILALRNRLAIAGGGTPAGRGRR